MKRFMAWLATAATLTFAVPASAGQTDPRLDSLFDRLKAAPETAAAQDIEEEIWRIWLISGDDRVDRIMAVGLRAMALRDHAAALAAFDEIVRMAPGFAEGWNKRATLHYMMGRFDASIADIRKTLALEPRHFGALSGLGLVNLALRREAAALEAFDDALEIHPHLPGADTNIRALREKLRGNRI